MEDEKCEVVNGNLLKGVHETSREFKYSRQPWKLKVKTWKTHQKLTKSCFCKNKFHP